MALALRLLLHGRLSVLFILASKCLSGDLLLLLVLLGVRLWFFVGLLWLLVLDLSHFFFLKFLNAIDKLLEKLVIDNPIRYHAC